MIKVISRYNIPDANLKKCLDELESEINKSLEDTSGNKIIDKDISKDDYTTINEGYILLDKKKKQIITRFNNKLYKANLSEI